MRKNSLIWSFFSLMVTLLIVFTACSQEGTEGRIEEENTSQTVSVGGDEDTEDTPVSSDDEGVDNDEYSSPDTPKYGGTFNRYMKMDVMGFDPILKLQMECSTLRMTNEELMQGDWTKGKGGTGETDWANGFIGRIELETGSLAESWETPDDETIIFHIRPGIHYGLDQNSEASRLVNGREYTAADAAYSIDKNFNTETAYSYMAYTRAGYGPTSIEVIDDYTVEVKVPATMHGLMLLVMGDNMFQVCSDVTEKYGDQNDWKRQVGTGPYFLTDYVASSSLTYKRNPDYWKKDPLHPENQLPYLDKVKALIITDQSTQQAALRTAKIDQLSSISWENAELLMKQAPDLLYHTILISPTLLTMRVDKPELPFYDINVRRAMNMAVDQREIVDSYYDGHAELLGCPYPPTPTHSKVYTPMNEQPEDVQEMFSYNPEKAKELLAAAGYPDGFQTQINCDMADSDYISIVREYLLAVGIDMEIKPLEASVMRSVGRGRTHEEMITSVCVDYSFPFRLLHLRQESFDNRSFIESPYSRQIYENINKVIGKDDAQVNELVKEVGVFSLQQAWAIWMPAAHSYTMWWPWVQGYHGEAVIGYDGQELYVHYLWTDMAMKKAMGY